MLHYWVKAELVRNWWGSVPLYQHWPSSPFLVVIMINPCCDSRFAAGIGVVRANEAGARFIGAERGQRIGKLKQRTPARFSSMRLAI